MAEDYSERRRADRQLSILSVRCRVSQGMSPQVWLTELSPLGCKLVIRAGSLTQGQRVVIKPKDIEGLPGVVKWISDIDAGIEFDQPLHQAIVDHLLAEPQQSGADKAIVDRFGRPMPELPRSTRQSRLRSCL